MDAHKHLRAPLARELGALGERLAAVQVAVDHAEEAWLALADEAEALGLEL